jgi:phosphoribosylanthranilate isomerase
VTPELAAALCARLPHGSLRVAVMHHPTAARWAHVRDVFAPDWVQTDEEDFATMTLGHDCHALPVVRRAEGRETLPPRLLFEGPDSGRGRQADWTGAASLAERCELVLAGGLDPDNVADAIRRVRPWGVDVSSGVETHPGRKDLRRIQLFIERARAAENRP